MRRVFKVKEMGIDPGNISTLEEHTIQIFYSVRQRHAG